ncbi:MAG: hypothetical protein BJ554DRAFT_2566, partial [Olpidium bornovanus]
FFCFFFLFVIFFFFSFSFFSFPFCLFFFFFFFFFSFFFFFFFFFFSFFSFPVCLFLFLFLFLCFLSFSCSFSFSFFYILFSFPRGTQVDTTGLLSHMATPVEFVMPAMFVQTRTAYEYRAVTHVFHDMLAALALDDLERAYGEHHWAIGHWDYFVPFLQANPHYRDTLRRWFPDGQVAHRVLRRAVRMKSGIEDRARIFAAKTPPGFTFDPAPIRSFANAALNLGAFSSGDPSNVTYFLAADDDGVRGEMGRLLGNVRYNSDIDWNDVGANGDPGGSDATALLDLRLLSLSDELVVTFGSTFGQWAASWGGL